MGGDTNAKSTWWGSGIIDHRGEDMAGFFEEMGLQVLNERDIPTHDNIRGNDTSTSYVDHTACTVDMLDLVDDWRVDEGMTSSDHIGITLKIKLKKTKVTIVNRTTRQLSTRKANWSIS